MKLTGLNRRTVGKGVGQLGRAGLLVFSAKSIRLDLELKPETCALVEELSCRRSGKRLIPVPRIALRYLARESSKTLGRVMIAYWARGLSLRQENPT